MVNCTYIEECQNFDLVEKDSYECQRALAYAEDVCSKHPAAESRCDCQCNCGKQGTEVFLSKVRRVYQKTKKTYLTPILESISKPFRSITKHYKNFKNGVKELAKKPVDYAKRLFGRKNR